MGQSSLGSIFFATVNDFRIVPGQVKFQEFDLGQINSLLSRDIKSEKNFQVLVLQCRKISSFQELAQCNK